MVRTAKAQMVGNSKRAACRCRVMLLAAAKLVATSSEEHHLSLPVYS